MILIFTATAEDELIASDRSIVHFLSRLFRLIDRIQITIAIKKSKISETTGSSLFRITVILDLLRLR